MDKNTTVQWPEVSLEKINALQKMVLEEQKRLFGTIVIMEPKVWTIPTT